jgi:hypothetical protein
MNRRVVVREFSASSLSGGAYDALIVALGFEQRARFVAGLVGSGARRHFACGFASRRELAYEANRRWMLGAGFEIEERTDTEFRAWWEGVLGEIVREHARDQRGDSCRICVDVSSQSRFRTASIIAGLWQSEAPCVIEVDFVYAGAKFRRPLQATAPIVTCAPVLPEFAGWSTEPDQHSVGIFGLGYELEKAVGAWEYIEPGSAWAFVPIGGDSRYQSVIRHANDAFWELLPAERIVEYAVEAPFDCFVTLESLSYGNRRNSRIVLVPFGPKIFAVCCLLVACLHSPHVAVWRISSGQFEAATDRIAVGEVTGLTAAFEPVEGGLAQA